jgi:hypothetical protein
MHLRRTTLALSIAAVTTVGLLPAFASSPSDSGTLTPSSNPGAVTASWTGTITGANANSDCT